MYMRLCGTTCSLAITFLLADIYMTISADKGVMKHNFMALLNNEQKTRYEKIIEERKNIYFKGYFVGIICSILFIFSTRDLKKTKWMSIGIVCAVGGITMLVNYLYYILSPKTDYMVIHLDGEDQRKAWLAIYRHMQLKYHIGLALGVVAAMLAAKATC